MRTFAAALAATLLVCPLAAAPSGAAARAETAPPAPPSLRSSEEGTAEPPPPLPILTLAEALRQAEAQNRDLQAARARVEQARAGVAKAWSGYLPQLAAGASYTRNSEGAALDVPTGFWVRETGTPQGPPAGQGTPGSPTTLAVVPSGTQRAVLQEQDQLGASLAVSQALVAPALWYGIRASREGAEAAAQGAEAARREVRLGVAQAYLGAVALRRLVDVSEELLAIARRQERDAGNRWRAGEVPRAAPVRAELDRARAEQDLVRAGAAYDGARIALAQLLDRDPAFDVRPAPEPGLPADLAGLVAVALRERPDLRSARQAEAAAGSERQAATMRYLPSLGAFGRWQVSNVSGFSGREDSWAVGVGLTWTLLDGGLREAEVREAGARVAEAAARRAGTEARATAEVRQALVDLAAARASALKAREQADLAAENQRLTERSWLAGAATAVELADAASARRNAEVAAATEELQAQVAARRLLYAAGLDGGEG